MKRFSLRSSAALFTAGMILCAAAPAVAQRPMVASGRVVKLEGSDSVAVGGVRLVLHRVGRSQQGPIDSTVSGPDGGFQFRFIPDTTVILLLSARFAGIEYFSSPVNSNPGLPDTALVVVVSDTSSTARVSQAARYLVIRRAAEDSSRAVLDLIVVVNKGSVTRISRDTIVPSWAGRIPQGVTGARVGQADVSADAVVLRNDSVLLFAPIAPGEKQISLEYLIPPGASIALPFPEDSVATNVLAQDAAAKVTGGALAAVDSQEIEGEFFHRWVGAPRPGDVVQVTFGGASSGGVPSWVLPLLVTLAAGGMLFGLSRLRARRVPVSINTLTDRIAQLEARYAGRQEETTPDEWQEYLQDRERLRAELTAHLAARRPSA
ncbi:MAG: hypothetical protein ABI679_04115 [Gemmatimonadota bacterium]